MIIKKLTQLDENAGKKKGKELFLLRPITVKCERWIEQHIEYNHKINGTMFLDFFLLARVLDCLRESGFNHEVDFEIFAKN